MVPFFPELIFRHKTREKKIWLTFDDGPTPGITPVVLQMLSDAEAKATFFCIGRNVEKNPDLYGKIILAGHSTGNHSYSHPNGFSTPLKRYLEDVAVADSFISPGLFRPPYGKLRPSQYLQLKKKYRIIMWDVLSKDYNRSLSKEKCLKSVLERTRPGSIIVFHDSGKAWKNLQYVLPRVLDHFSEKGYSFCGIS